VKGSARTLFSVFLVGILCLTLWGCGGSVARYDPGAPAVPSGLAVLASDDGSVSLSWSEADKAAAYNVYYSTVPGVTSATGTQFGTTSSANSIVTGLTNDTQYYFVVSAVNSSGESAVSNEVSATPAVPGSFAQSDLVGTWRFNILVSGSSSGWMRGTLTADDTGAVTISPFLDNAGGTAAPAELFPALLVNPSGQVRDAVNVQDALFKGVMGGAQRKIIVGTMVTTAGARLFVVLQKHDPLVTFSNAGDIAGFGNTAGGARRFAYMQLSSGSSQEWEYALGQIGRTAPFEVQYTTFSNPSGATTPGSATPANTKVSSMSITADGIVTEVRGASVGLPEPTLYIPAGVMSDDKSLIVAVATDAVNPGKYILRIYGMINIVPSDPNTFSLSDLAGTYSIESLIVGTSTLSASGVFTTDGVSGDVSFVSYLDSNGNTTPPAGFTLAITSDGILSNAADPTFHGKLAHNKDIAITTKTEAAGLYSLSISLKNF